MEYEKYNNKPIFSYPRRIETTRNGNIFIVDEYQSNRGIVVVIRPNGACQFYNTNTDDKPFYPISILVTTRDNVLILDYYSNYLHIMNNEGDLVTYFNLTEIGIVRPHSLAMSPLGSLYIGNINEFNAPEHSKSSLYELEFFNV